MRPRTAAPSCIAPIARRPDSQPRHRLPMRSTLPPAVLAALLLALPHAAASHFIGPFGGGQRTGTGNAATGDAPAQVEMEGKA